MTEMIIRKEGVGALILKDENRFLTIEELQSSRDHQRLSGMRSMSFETIEPGETHQQALVRALAIEEFKLGRLTGSKLLTNTKLCQVQINTGIWLHAYLIPIVIPEGFLITVGESIDEVANPDWARISDALAEQIGSRRFRPGNREILQSYLKYRQGLLSSPDIYFTTQDKIPDEVFDGHEVTQNKVPSPLYPHLTV